MVLGATNLIDGGYPPPNPWMLPPHAHVRGDPGSSKCAHI